MNLKTKLAAAMVLAASASMAQATTTAYNVAGVVYEPMAQAGDTTFHLSMVWDSMTQSITSLMGTMNSSMDSAVEDINLNGLFTTSTVSNGGIDWVVATVYKNATSSIFAAPTGTETQIGDFIFGTSSPTSTTIKDLSKQIDNGITQNAFATFAFDPTNPLNANGWLTAYGDCTADGMMMQICMTGHAGKSVTTGGAPGYTANGTMGATVDGNSLMITAAPVPVPAAAWLFGGALLSLFGANRRKSVLPA